MRSNKENPKSVFVLTHSYEEKLSEFERIRSAKEIGIFSKRDAALVLVEKLKGLVGFRSWPDGFRVEEFQVDNWRWCHGFTQENRDELVGQIEVHFFGEPKELDASDVIASPGDVYFLQHSYELEDREIIRDIGIFSSYEGASTIRNKLKQQNGFVEWPNGFNIDRYSLDQGFAFETGFVYD